MARRYPPIPEAGFSEFVRIVRRLRKDCPWDRKQTHRSLRASLIEETYEVIESLEKDNREELCAELGDLLLHIVLHATIAEQAGEFTFGEVLDGISRKLIRRHPHVFGTKKALSADAVKRNWEKLKMGEGRSSLLEGIPRGMPSLQRALRVQQRAANVGFDWKKTSSVWKKVREELEEFRRTLRAGDAARREEEYGDLLFALVNYARFVRVNPEHALHASVRKFIDRFQYVEREVYKSGRDIHATSLEEMDALWEKAKRRRKPLTARRKQL